MNKELKTYLKKYRLYDETLKIIEEEFKNLDGLNILDISCGLITILNIIPFGDKYGLNICIYKLAKKRFDLNEEIFCLPCDGELIPIKDDSFDIIFSTNSLDHIPNLERFLNEIKRVLKKWNIF